MGSLEYQLLSRVVTWGFSVSRWGGDGGAATRELPGRASEFTGRSTVGLSVRGVVPDIRVLERSVFLFFG